MATIAPCQDIRMKSFFEKVKLAQTLKLIPDDVSEIEFTVEHGTKQAVAVEYWLNCPRLDSEHVFVHIPEEQQHLFVFDRFL